MLLWIQVWPCDRTRSWGSSAHTRHTLARLHEPPTCPATWKVTRTQETLLRFCYRQYVIILFSSHLFLWCEILNQANQIQKYLQIARIHPKNNNVTFKLENCPLKTTTQKLWRKPLWKAVARFLECLFFFFNEGKEKLSVRPRNPTARYLSKWTENLRSCRNLHTNVYNLTITARNWKKPRLPPVGEWTNSRVPHKRILLSSEKRPATNSHNHRDDGS